jgi:hypothetical protein
MQLMATRRFETAALAVALLAVTAVAAQADQLVLQVDRFTGAAALRNPAANTTSIQFISYTLNSPSNPLASSDARWKSLQDAGVPNWFEANPTTANLSELASAGSFSMAPGASQDFGTPLDASTSAPLRTNRVNLSGASFKYQHTDGALVNAAIETVGRYNDLVLVVNPATGFATLQNQSAQPIEFISYTISSAMGSLLPSYAGSGRPNWFTANPTANNLSELGSTSSIVLNEGGEVDLGLAWSTVGSQDLNLIYQATSGSLLPGTVHFGEKATISSGASADFDGNGFVNATDLNAWKAGFGSGTTRAQGDADGDLRVNGADFLIWQRQLGTAPAVAGTRVVPEPTAVGLLIMGDLLALSAFRRPKDEGRRVRRCRASQK